MSNIPFRFLQRRTSTSGRTPDVESLLNGELYVQLADETIYFKNDKCQLVSVVTSSSLNKFGTGSFITTGMTGNFGGSANTGSLTGIFAPIGNYVTVNQTGNFITTSMTGAFGGASGVDLTSYVTTGSTGNFITTLQTGDLSSVFAPTGDYVFVDQTGSFVTTSQTGNFATINSGYLLSSQIPTITGDICIVAGTNNALICQLQGYPVSTATPANGQTLQFNGTSWVPGDIAAGGNGGGGLVYYFNERVAADLPTGNLPHTISGAYELGRSGITGQFSFQTPDLPTANYTGVVGFITDVLDPNISTIPAGLFDFNFWASSNTSTQTIVKLEVYKYDGATTTATLIASSDDIYTYDGAVTAQYIGSVVLPQTTITSTDRLYIRYLAKALANHKRITFYFGGNTPSHVHTTVPSVGGSGLVKVINGIMQSRASLITNSDISGSAGIEASKIQSGVFALCSETGIFETTGYARNCFVNTGQTGVYETTGYARNCYVTTGQTGTFGGGGGSSGVNTIYESFTSSSIINTNLINFDVIPNSTLFYTGNSSSNFYINLRGNASCTFNNLLPLNNSLSVSFAHVNGASCFALTGVNIDGTARSVIWAGGGGTPSGVPNATNVYSITTFKTGSNSFRIFGSLGFFS